MKVKAVLLVLLMIFTVQNLQAEEMIDFWLSFKKEFISSDGRIIDYHNNQISHSEGQGYGMLFALEFNDLETFEKVWRWTKDNLQVRKNDKLFAWQWGKRPNGEWNVIDYNNATDGDILIAFALLKASEKFNRIDYKNEAFSILSDIKKHLYINFSGMHLLLPGYYGFYSEKTITVNPSYFIFPAFELFALLDERDFWEKIIESSLFILGRAKFGIFAFPPNWIELENNEIRIKKQVQISDEEAKLKYENFGFDAIRVPLYLALSNREKIKEKTKDYFSLIEIYKKNNCIPAEIYLQDEQINKNCNAPAGFYAVYSLIAKAIGDKKLSDELFAKAKEILRNEERNYYSWSLFLLCSMVGKR
ncbi:glycosyl hydrolase family 8 [Thermodesulfovibrio hydrogeniphilus]